jgi:hypothetical protein
VSLYWKNPDPRRYVNVVPTSAITGEGIPDLLQLMVKLTQSMMQERLTLLSETQCTVSAKGFRAMWFRAWVLGFVVSMMQERLTPLSEMQCTVSTGC